MIALVFPGQGSQTKGMIKDFYDNFPLVREIFDKISNSSQIDVKDIIFNDNNRSLDITEFTQISIFCASISIFSVIKNIYGSMLDNWGYGTYDCSQITHDIFYVIFQ